MTETNIKDMTIDQVKELCIINNIKNWKKMSMENLLNIKYDPNIAIPQISLDTIKEQFPSISENLKGLVCLGNKDVTEIKEIYGSNLIRLDKENIKKIKIPGTYYVLIHDKKINTHRRTSSLHKMTFILYDKEDDVFSVYYKNTVCLLYYENDKFYGYSQYGMYADICMPSLPVYVFTT